MYVLKCVKPGYFNYDQTAGTGEFLTDDTDATRSINRAELFYLKTQANAIKRHSELPRGKGNAVFAVTKVAVTEVG